MPLRAHTEWPARRFRLPAARRAELSRFSSRAKRRSKRSSWPSPRFRFGDRPQPGPRMPHDRHPAIVTSSEDRVIHELNGRPALDVFLEETGFAGVAMDDGTSRRSRSRIRWRSPSSTEASESGTSSDGMATRLVCATRVPENAAVMFTRETPRGGCRNRRARASSEALASLGRGARAGRARLRLRRPQAGRRGLAVARGLRPARRLPGPAPAARRPLHPW